MGSRQPLSTTLQLPSVALQPPWVLANRCRLPSNRRRLLSNRRWFSPTAPTAPPPFKRCPAPPPPPKQHPATPFLRLAGLLLKLKDVGSPYGFDPSHSQETRWQYQGIVFAMRRANRLRWSLADEEAEARRGRPARNSNRVKFCFQDMIRTLIVHTTPLEVRSRAPPGRLGG